MNSYETLRQKQQAEVNALPLYWAFDNMQFEELLIKLGVPESKVSEMLCKGPCGSIALKTDANLIAETFKRHAKERKAAEEADLTGDGYLYEMFVAELSDQEYGYTGRLSDTLDALGLSEDDIESDPRMRHALQKALGRYAF